MASSGNPDCFRGCPRRLFGDKPLGISAMRMTSRAVDNKRMVFLTCRVNIKSSLPLEDVAEIVSAHLLGGVSFVGKEQHVRDEVPAVYSSEYVLGARFLLLGEPDEEGYSLQVSDHQRLAGSSAPQITESLVDISADAVALLARVGSIRASLPPSQMREGT